MLSFCFFQQINCHEWSRGPPTETALHGSARDSCRPRDHHMDPREGYRACCEAQGHAKPGTAGSRLRGDGLTTRVLFKSVKSSALLELRLSKCVRIDWAYSLPNWCAHGQPALICSDHQDVAAQSGDTIFVLWQMGTLYNHSGRLWPIGGGQRSFANISTFGCPWKDRLLYNNKGKNHFSSKCNPLDTGSVSGIKISRPPDGSEVSIIALLVRDLRSIPPLDIFPRNLKVVYPLAGDSRKIWIFLEIIQNYHRPGGRHFMFTGGPVTFSHCIF